jgi:molybdenum cofactor cytidylyltransferase
MGQPKALLTYQGQTFIDSIIQNVKLAGIENIFVVTGRHGTQIRNKINNPDSWTYLNNPDPDRGQLSSIQIGLTHLTDDVIGMLLVLVDHPLVMLSTYQVIMSKANQYPDSIVIPSFDGKNGHPVYFGRKYFKELLQAPLDKGARAVVHKYHGQIIKICVKDKGVLQDIDLPEDYQNLVEVKIPSEKK